MTRSVVIIGTRGYPSFYGGFETAVRHLVSYLADRGWEVTVYGRRGHTVESWPKRDVRISSIITRGVDSSSFSTLSYGLTSTLRAVKSRPDVALVMNVANGYFLPLLWFSKIPSVVNVDGIEWNRQKWGRLARLVFKRGASLVGRWATRIIVDSLAIGSYWKEEFGREGTFIPYGADEVAPLPLEAGLERRGYVLMVARLVPENSVAQFLTAAESILESTALEVVGVGSLAGVDANFVERIEALQKRFTRFRWLGHLSDDSRLFSLWQHAGVYFHGHTVGGTNPALVQAMACGAPTVARDTVYNREVLETAGIFVDDRSESLVEAIVSLAEDAQQQEHLGNMARERAREHYTWEKVLSSYEEELIKAIDSASRGSRATST